MGQEFLSLDPHFLLDSSSALMPLPDFLLESLSLEFKLPSQPPTPEVLGTTLKKKLRRSELPSLPIRKSNFQMNSKKLWPIMETRTTARLKALKSRRPRLLLLLETLLEIH